MPGDKASEKERRRQILDAALYIGVEKGLEGVTGRAVSIQAGLSSGLVFFYYPTKDALLMALLETLILWLFGSDEVESSTAPVVGQRHFADVLREEMELQGEDRERIQLLLEYWVLSKRHRGIQERLYAAMERSRSLFQSLAFEALSNRKQLAQEVTSESLAALAVSLIAGYALQDLLHPHWLASAHPVLIVEALLQKKKLN